MIFSAALPHSVLMYPMLWNDALSDTFFHAAEFSMGWIAILNALEGAAGCGLGYIDYKTKHVTDEHLKYSMRKKRLAFSKFSFIMATLSLYLLDTPSHLALIPLIMGSVWNALKIGT